MGIKITNTVQFVLEGSLIGNAGVQHVKCFRAPYDGKVAMLGMAIGVAGVTGSQVADCLINGTSIFATAGNRPTITTALDSGDVTTAAKIDGTRTFKKGDLITLSIAAVHSGTPAVDTAIVAILNRTKSPTNVEYFS